MKASDITYFPDTKNKGVWIIFGIIEWESKDMLKVVTERPSKKRVRKITDKHKKEWGYKYSYDCFIVEQWPVSK
jgi:hypothetical protein